uniref:DNA polymerase III subunit gamma/tau n=1 Tax=Eubacterium cellulosolvens TaxID=29322 RepID=UPI0004823299|nr:DNA polymerase III subunit gamma/tau [[Eubacterium] cellulosolvens]
MSYQALYRKFRPTTFDEVKGQDHIVKTLKNQLRANRIGHAYLFCGTRGTGKTTIAKVFARAVNCEHPLEDGSPCNECETCRGILKGTSNNVIEIDAASNNGVDNIREIREEVGYRPTQGKYKVYIIDEVHMLSTGAFNALLKTLEEPPEYVIFILATTEINKIPVTILSRCQRYNFHRITIDTIAGRLSELLTREKVEAEERAVRYVAKTADGSMRDALSLLDQCIAFYLGEKLTYEKVLEVLGTVDTDVFSRLLRCVIAGDASSSVRILGDMVREGKEMGQFVTDFIWYLRNLMLVQNSEDLEDVLDVSTENLEQLREESKMIDSEVLMRYIRILSDLSGQLRFATQKQILVESALIRLCRPQMDTDLSGVLDRIRQLEEKLEKGTFVQQASPQNPGVSVSAGAGVPAQTTDAPVKVQKAAPEDLVKIRSMWRKIVGMCGQPLRGCLDSAVPKYDGADGGQKLYIEVGNAIAAEQVKLEQHMEELRNVIIRLTGKEAMIEVVTASSGGPGTLAEIPLEELLVSEIQGIPIEDFDGAEEEF